MKLSCSSQRHIHACKLALPAHQRTRIAISDSSRIVTNQKLTKKGHRHPATSTFTYIRRPKFFLPNLLTEARSLIRLIGAKRSLSRQNGMVNRIGVGSQKGSGRREVVGMGGMCGALYVSFFLGLKLGRVEAEVSFSFLFVHPECICPEFRSCFFSYTFVSLNCRASSPSSTPPCRHHPSQNHAGILVASPS